MRRRFVVVENDGVGVAAIADAMHAAAARRCRNQRLVVVPMDESSLSLPDPRGTRGFGPVGTHHKMTTGMHVISALAVDRDGTPLGLLDQQWWVRSKVRVPDHKGGSKRDPRPPEARESFNWVRSLRAASARLRENAPDCTPWFQLDRAGDCRVVFEVAEDERILITVRARGDRRLQYGDGKVGYLRHRLRAQFVAAHFVVDVPERPDQPSRRARLELRFTTVPLAVPISSSQRRIVTMNAILANEVDVPRGAKPLCWVLLTNRRIETVMDALQVVSAYTLRWRVEDFHKAWKSGACDIEASQLRKRDHFLRWATIMAAVAVRIERLKHLARKEPNRPATDEFSRDEIDAAILLRKAETHVEYELGETPTLAEVTRWIADLGGYMGSKKAPPPGTIVLRRGLEQVAAAVAARTRSSHADEGEKWLVVSEVSEERSDERIDD